MNTWNVAVCAGGEQREAEVAELVANLNLQPGYRVGTYPDLYHLAPDDPALADLRQLKGPLAVVSFHHPRALFWLLQERMVAGFRADLEDNDPAQRPIYCLDARCHCCPERIVEALVEITGKLTGAPSKEPRHFASSEQQRWYPVVDYNRCTACMQCLEFCLFGVFAAGQDGKLAVAEPNRCKAGCPACSRVCPQDAIMFPLFRGIEAIAGADTGKIPEFKPEELSGYDLPEECAREIEQHLRPGCGCQCQEKADPLDQALDQLGEEDENR